VDIGLHYVAVSQVGDQWVPIDTDGDGWPDYFEDRNGNGDVDPGETDWRLFETDTGPGPGLVVFTPMKP
jgi:hypothetical protein